MEPWFIVSFFFSHVLIRVMLHCSHWLVLETRCWLGTAQFFAQASQLFPISLPTIHKTNFGRLMMMLLPD